MQPCDYYYNLNTCTNTSRISPTNHALAVVAIVVVPAIAYIYVSPVTYHRSCFYFQLIILISRIQYAAAQSAHTHMSIKGSRNVAYCSYLITGPSEWLNMIQGTKVLMITKSTPSEIQS